MRVRKERLRVQLIHGLEGSPKGRKAQVLARHFDTLTPAMDTSDFEGAVWIQAEALARHRPQVLVGSSFGGAVALALLQRGLWRGPTLLLAQAGLRRGLPPDLPPGIPVWIVHAPGDAVVPFSDSERLARAGDPARVRLIAPRDDHALTESTRSGALVRWVSELGRAGREPGNAGNTLPETP